MLTAIEGYYEKGEIVLKEIPPVATKTAVIVTFLTDLGNQQPIKPTKRVLGALEGKIKIPDDFNEPLEDLKDYM
jgi:hypothetical protein